MTRLQELTAAPSCWQENVLQHVSEAMQEVQRLKNKDQHRVFAKEAPSESALQAFEDWFRSHVPYENASVRMEHVGEEGNGLVSEQAIAEDELFLSIPYDIVLGSSMTLGPQMTAREQAAWKQLEADPLLAQFPSCMLALRLLAEAAKPASFFQPYLNILPTGFDVPLFYEPADFAAIENSALFGSAVRLVYNSIKQFCYLERQLSRWEDAPIPRAQFTVGNYFWALGVVLTRQNEVVVAQNAKPALALIPGWDLCNHEQGTKKITTYSDPQARAVACHAMRSFQPNEQVKMFYGHRSNAEFLLYSGFVAQDNAFDCVQVPLQTDSAAAGNDPLFKIRRMLIAKETGSMDDSPVFADVDITGSILSPAVTRVLQIMSMNKTGLSASLRQSATVVGTNQIYPWDEELKASALKQFHEACRLVQTHLTQTAQQKTKAKRAELFSRYFQGQLRILDAALANASPFPTGDQ